IRKFKSKIGITPHQFLIQVRVRNAQKDIAAGGRLIDAAIDNGFYDSSHFDKCFQKIVGIPPSEYSKKTRQI
ncbi:MAG: helix-turn-helix domain-containing protein, partial [Bacteroidales bacterium]|nr:helix-turn-helix domain-containing protein [Bacteroidales bacterium]